MLTDGIDYHFTHELSKEERIAKVSVMLKPGNHKSILEDSNKAGKLVQNIAISRYRAIEIESFFACTFITSYPGVWETA